jgi:hypothetical protein
LIDDAPTRAAIDRDISPRGAQGEQVEHEPTAMISRHRHERRVWTGSDGCAVDSSRLRDYARGRGGGVGS